ncbi:MAG: hypothetical protein U1E93_09160 [Alphaproteobacteria bacterium]
MSITTGMKFDIIAPDAGVSDGSPMRERLEKAFDRIEIGKLADEEAAHASAPRKSTSWST